MVDAAFPHKNAHFVPLMHGIENLGACNGCAYTQSVYIYLFIFRKGLNTRGAL